jgi:hypothetical protein
MFDERYPGLPAEHVGKALFDHEMVERGVSSKWEDLDDDERLSWLDAAGVVVKAAAPDDRRKIEILSRALAWHGDPARMATTREEWQQTIDDALVWVRANPEPGRPSFSSFTGDRAVELNIDAQRQTMEAIDDQRR